MSSYNKGWKGRGSYTHFSTKYKTLLHGHTIQGIFSYPSVEIKKKSPKWGFFGSKYPNFSKFTPVYWPYFSMDSDKKKAQPLIMTHTLWLMINIKHLKTRCWLSDFANFQKFISRIFWIFFSFSKKILPLLELKEYYRIVYIFHRF